MKDSRHFTSLEEWRNWLQLNHDKADVLWLIYYKKHTGKPSISYKDSLQEALCWGWIDSIIKRIDAERYARKFTPRTNCENWSEVNIRHMKQLLNENRVQPAGKDKFPDHLLNRKLDLRSKVLEIPDYIQLELDRNKTAKENFDNLASSYRRQYIVWIDIAKKPETKQRRLKEAISLLEAGKKLGMK